jgi:propionyl-CoA carboxylase alpha chain
MFKKILIANRGEIACRVIKTARRHGHCHRGGLFRCRCARALRAMADEAVHIGPAPAAQSYLIPEKIIAACKATGAEAVHPGYGFLSERTSFAEALAAENIAFIGPPVGAIAAMGDKIESRSWPRPPASTSCPAMSARSTTPTMRCALPARSAIR